MTEYIENNFYMYGTSIGPRGNGCIPIKFIYEINDLVIYMIEDGFTKMVSNKGHERYYTGYIKDFDFNNWDKYNNSGSGGYKIKNYGNPFKIQILRKMYLDKDTKLSDVDTNLFKIDKQKQTLTYSKEETINIKDIRSEEIRNYCIKQIPECFLTSHAIKLSDFDTTLFKIDKQNHTITYKDVKVNIKDIQSDEIKNYCVNELKSADDKDICKYIIDTINYNHLNYSKIVTLNLELFNSLKSSQNKLYILKYVFSKYRELTELANKEELFKIFVEYPSFVIDLIRQMISTNNKNLEYILKNKVILIDRHEYKKLQDYACSLHLFDLTNILTIYESLYYMLNDKVDIKESNLKDELWN